MFRRLISYVGLPRQRSARDRRGAVASTFAVWVMTVALAVGSGMIDDVEITALGSPYMTGTPCNPVTIPVPFSQPGSTLSFTGFSIITCGQ
jgi:hypothetical protein